MTNYFLFMLFGLIMAMVGAFNQIWALYAISFVIFVYSAVNLILEIWKDESRN